MRDGFKLVGSGAGEKRPEPDEDPELGATGFYYVAAADDWEDAGFSGRRRFSRLVTLPAYIWRELLKGVLLSLAVFSVILMAIFAGQVMRDGVGPYTMLRVTPNFLPLICPFVLPLAIITGILICYSRLAKDNEILAAYAGGVNPFWLALPAVLTSILAIFITLTLNEVAMMPAIRNIESLVMDDQANILRRMISRPGNVTVQAGGEFLAMSKLDPSFNPGKRATLDITRFATTAPGQTPADFAWDPKYPYPAKRIVARDHRVQEFSETEKDELVLKMLVTKPVFQDLHAADINRTFIADGESGEERIVLGGRPKVTLHANRSAFWPILMLSETRNEAEDRLQEIESGGRRLEDMDETQQAATANTVAWLRGMISLRTAEINMRLALCFSCLAFAILGIPLGMRTRGTLMYSFAIGIFVSGIYFLILKSAEAQVSRGFLPYWTIWIPDALVIGLGALLWMVNFRRS